MAPAVVGIWEYKGSPQTAQLTAVGKACEADVPCAFLSPGFPPFLGSRVLGPHHLGWNAELRRDQASEMRDDATMGAPPEMAVGKC